MDANELKLVLDDHVLWLSNGGGKRADLREADLRRADLGGADLSRADLRGVNLSTANLSMANLSMADLGGADLSGVNLSRANLSEADLRGANLDFSCLPLWCGGLDFTIDEKIAKQLMYHVLNLMIYSEIEIPTTPQTLVEFANRIHRSDVEMLSLKGV